MMRLQEVDDEVLLNLLDHTKPLTYEDLVALGQLPREEKHQ